MCREVVPGSCAGKLCRCKLKGFLFILEIRVYRYKIVVERGTVVLRVRFFDCTRHRQVKDNKKTKQTIYICVCRKREREERREEKNLSRFVQKC